MAAFSTEKLAGACLAHGLSGEGTNAELHTRLGHHLVNKLFSGKRKKSEEASAHVQTNRSASASQWHAFMKSERANVVASGVQGRASYRKSLAAGKSSLDQAIEAHGLDKTGSTDAKITALALATSQVSQFETWHGLHISYFTIGFCGFTTRLRRSRTE